MRRLRTRRVRAFLGFDEVSVADELSLVSRDASPEQRAFVKRLYEVLESVPTNARVAWTLRYLEGETLEAVAELCECSLATAKRRIAEAHAIIEGAVGE
jgi:RNA polymerase sigma-70 factor (ECF subfamily)